MHNTPLPKIPSSLGLLGAAGAGEYDERGRFRLPRSSDKVVSREYGSPNGPTHQPVTFLPDQPSWLEQQRRLALAKTSEVGL